MPDAASLFLRPHVGWLLEIQQELSSCIPFWSEENSLLCYEWSLRFLLLGVSIVLVLLNVGLDSAASQLPLICLLVAPMSASSGPVRTTNSYTISLPCHFN